ncbi:MAG: YhcH/YjgK/YiaL family protein [Prevotella sp.]|jgi:YhcH/YjgK/YiaL family protein|nr:YhcH/YjgK/YiaL family protein [Prevotella sp.]MBP6527105.1 YhcH/YjgK/YiaL family protein [Prevotella sp.]MBP8686342.1 YhcH/YjgK/YiaL family protein [Prevotella sp.]MBP8934479.1 YhcH/YjgK/YiaL family protein [Prevotella sp.]MBP9981979.1 YhcH/YjgK/YiaL family protein [Prevotella sp.]
MIIDKIENLFKYINMNPLFADVVKFLESNDLNTLEEGKHEIKGTDLFVNVQAKPGKKLQDAVLEYHKKMIDIQIPVSDSETFGYTPVDELPEVEFDEQKDIAKLPGLEAQTYVTINPGQMAIFFPQDGHAPCISESGCLRKVILKILA